jgi:hypothetical protein
MSLDKVKKKYFLNISVISKYGRKSFLHLTKVWIPAGLVNQVLFECLMIHEIIIFFLNQVHIKILIMEAKRQALLLYAMRAITHHMM